MTCTKILHMYLHTHTGDYQHLAVQLTEAQASSRIKLQEQSRSHEEELVRVRGMPSVSSPCVYNIDTTVLNSTLHDLSL